MNPTITTDEMPESPQVKPGQYLAQQRAIKGYSQKFIADKLHLLVGIIEHLEADNYTKMPEPVFIKGYLRAYANLLDIPSEPLVENFNAIYSPERKLERALWQSKRESHKGERMIRLLTGAIAIAALAGVGLWWLKNKDLQAFFPTKSSPVVAEIKKSDTELKLTDLSKLHTVLTPLTHEMTPLERNGG